MMIKALPAGLAERKGLRFVPTAIVDILLHSKFDQALAFRKIAPIAAGLFLKDWA
jgi:hypothetical protein